MNFYSALVAAAVGCLAAFWYWPDERWLLIVSMVCAGLAVLAGLLPVLSRYDRS